LTNITTMKLAQALSELVGSANDALPAVVPTTRYVTIALASVMTGFTQKAIRRKIEDRVWIEGRQFKRAPDGHLMIDMEGYTKWVEKAAA
jgi:hypothetical protein